MAIRIKPEPYCPRCGARMVLRRPGAGQIWDPFWGCSQYPTCKGTRDVLSNGEPEPDDMYDDDSYSYGARNDYSD